MRTKQHDTKPVGQENTQIKKKNLETKKNKNKTETSKQLLWTHTKIIKGNHLKKLLAVQKNRKA